MTQGTLMAQSKAAPNLFTVVDLPKNLTEAQEEMVAKIEKYPNLKKITYVDIADVDKLQSRGYFDFSIPDEPTKTLLRVKLKRLEVTDSQNSFVYGLLQDNFGEVMLTKDKGLVFGTMRCEKRPFLIYGIDKHLSAILELNATTNDEFKQECANRDKHEETPPVVSTPPPPTPESILPCIDGITTSVLILFTANAQTVDPNINQTALNSINAHNSILANSQVTASGTRLRSVGVQLLPNFTENSSNLTNDVALLSSNPTANNARNTTGADIVVLLTNGQYGTGSGSVGRVRQVNAEDPNAYAIVERFNSVHPDFNTFSHEVGHLFGGQHQVDNDPRCTPYSHGQLFNVTRGWWIFTTTTRYRTMMGVAIDESSQRVPYFSNPNMDIYGHASSIVGFSEVARVIGETAPLISGYRNTPSPFSTNILGTDYVSYPGTFSYEPEIVCGLAPFSTVWQVNYSNGLSYSVPTVNDEPLDITIFQSTDYEQGFITISMTVTSSDGRVSTSFKNITYELGGAMIRDPKGSDKADKFVVSKEINSFSEIFPNPSSSTASFDYNLLEPTHLKVVLMDGLGKIVKSVIDEDKQKGYYQHKMSVSDLNSGLYFLQIVSDKQSLTKKILIQH
jgi:Secretion system C-terminal sorting domain/Metallo-peptidase family M12B Reprolysin-like